ncbi:MAG: hypothetical protein IJ042_05435, partial [Butyricicoccus sp.]|nr:hypothetical protein [Butyricicoccus sp.]
TARAGETWGVFSYLYAYPEGADTAVDEEFMNKVASCTFEAVPAKGSAKPDTTLPEHMEDRAFATMAANAYFTTATHESELVWTLEMKNGDTIILEQGLYTAEDMSPIEEDGAQTE